MHEVDSQQLQLHTVMVLFECKHNSNQQTFQSDCNDDNVTCNITIQYNHLLPQHKYRCKTQSIISKFLPCDL